MSDLANFLRELRAAVDQLFAHRKALRQVRVRFGFYPDGLVISSEVSYSGPIKVTLEEAGQACASETIEWSRLDKINPAELIGIVDRACQPAHDLLIRKTQR